jgi:Fe-S-cluster containining protein
VRYDDAKVHLRVFDEDHEVSCRVAVGPAPVTALVGPARALTEAVAAIAIADARRAGKEPSCRMGCGTCCRQLVPVAPVEAVHLAALVAAMPHERQREVRARFDAAVRRMEELGLVDAHAARGRSTLQGTARAGKSAWDEVSARYFGAAIPCPFLEAESCTIYADRPTVCAEYTVTTPAEWCGELSERVESVARPLRMNEILAGAGHAVAGAADSLLPLTLALEWAEVHGASLAGERDGEASFWALMEAIERDQEASDDSSGRDEPSREEPKT